MLTLAGENAGSGASIASTTTVSAKAVPVPRAPATRATASASSAERSVRMKTALLRLIPPTRRLISNERNKVQQESAHRQQDLPLADRRSPAHQRFHAIAGALQAEFERMFRCVRRPRSSPAAAPTLIRLTIWPRSSL